jgi:raffinose/stachyose/melibiose transport system substrate-binding protein
MKKFAAAALLALSLLSFAAAEDKVTIWGWRPQDADLWTKVQSTMQAQGTKVTIDYKTYLATEYDSKLFVSLQSGSGPDIFYTRRLPSASRTQALIDGKYIVPLNGKVDLKNFTDVTLSFISEDGKTWGVPFANQVIGIFYNTEIFNKYNLKEPGTWPELLQVCETLKKNGITPIFASNKDAWTLAMQNAMVSVSYPGEAWLGKLTKGQAKFTDPEYVEMLTALNDLKKYYQEGFSANSAAEQDVAFSMGQAGMVFGGIFQNSNWLKTNPDFKFGYFPVPSKTKAVTPKVYVYMDGSYGLYSGSKNQTAALKVLNFAATPAFGKIFSETTGEITAMKGVAMPASKPFLQECYQYANTQASAYRYWVGSPFDAGKPSVYDLLSENMQSMYLGVLAPADFAKKIQDGVSTWYPAFKK